MRRLALVLLALAACRGKTPQSSSVSAPTTAAIEKRFALGVVPEDCVPGLGEAGPLCCIEFAPSPLIAAETTDAGATFPRLVKEGRFEGGCLHLHRAYESVKVAGVNVSMVATRNVGRSLGLPGAGGFELSTRPDDYIRLRASPLDAAGRALDPGEFSLGDGPLKGYARWKWLPGCERAVRQLLLERIERPGDGFDRPSEEIGLRPVAAGTCTLEVEYLGARTRVTVTVRDAGAH